MARLELAKTNSQNWCNTIMRHLDLKFSSVTKSKGVWEMLESKQKICLLYKEMYLAIF